MLIRRNYSSHAGAQAHEDAALGGILEFGDVLKDPLTYKLQVHIR